MNTGKQKEARERRLKSEIIRYVKEHPGCTANTIVSALSCEKGMKNHGLTPRKVGFIIPRLCKDALTHTQDKGRRIYLPR